MMRKMKEKIYALDDSIDWAFVYDGEELSRQNYYAEGESAGFEKGEALGLKKGEALGLEKGQRTIIEALYESGMKEEEIHRATKIPLEKIASLLTDQIDNR